MGTKLTHLASTSCAFRHKNARSQSGRKPSDWGFSEQTPVDTFLRLNIGNRAPPDRRPVDPISTSLSIDHTITPPVHRPVAPVSTSLSIGHRTSPVCRPVAPVFTSLSIGHTITPPVRRPVAPVSTSLSIGHRAPPVCRGCRRYGRRVPSCPRRCRRLPPAASDARKSSPSGRTPPTSSYPPP